MFLASGILTGKRGAESAFGPTLMGARGKMPRDLSSWDFSRASGTERSGHPKNGMRTVNMSMVDETDTDQMTLFGHAIFSVRESEARHPTALTLDGLNAFLLSKDRGGNAFATTDSIMKFLFEYEVRFCGFFCDFANSAFATSGVRTFSLVVGGLHDVRVPIGEAMPSNQWRWLFFEPVAEDASKVQGALAGRKQRSSISATATGRTVYIRARVAPEVEGRGVVFTAGHVSSTRVRYVPKADTLLEAACEGVHASHVQEFALHVIPAPPSCGLYV